MPQYQVTDPESGMSLTLEGDSEPTEQELTDIFAAHALTEQPKPQPQEPAWRSFLRPITQSFVQSPIELQQNVAKVPELAAKVAEPIQETASDVASDFLRRTGIDPSAMPGRPIIEPVSIEERMGPEEFNRLPKSVQALVGFHDAMERTASGFTEPGQAALLPVLGTKPAQALIAAQSLAGASEVGRRLGEAKTPSETTGALTEGAINALIGAGVGSHLLPRELRVLPKASQAALETIKERTESGLASNEIETLRLANETRKSNELQTGTQTRPEGSASLSPLEKEQSASTAWLDSIARNDQEASAIAEAELLGESLESKAGQEGVLGGAYGSGSEVRTPGSSGTATGQGAPAVGTRTPQERGRIGQLTGESGAIAGGHPYLQAPRSSSGPLGQAFRQLQDVSNPEQAALGARTLLDVLSKDLPSEVKQEISKQIKDIVYARSIRKAKTVHGDVPAQPVEGEGQVPVKEGGQGVQPQAEVGVTPEVPLELKAIQERDANRLKEINAELERLKASRSKPTTKSEAFLQGDPFLEGQTPWNPQLEEKISALEYEASNLQKMLRSDQPTVPKEPTPTPEATIVPKVEEQPQVSDVGPAMGADVLGEGTQGTSLKNAIGEVERAQRGLPEATPTQKKSMATTWVLASEELKSNPRAGEVIVQELKADPTRGLTDVDSAVLLRHKVAVENALNDAAERTITAKTDAERAVAQDEFARLSDQNLEILDMAKERGSQWGTEGRWRQAIANEDFSLATMETRMRQAVGGRRLTDAEHTKLVELTTKLKARVAELESAQRAGVEAGREKATKEAVDEAGKAAGKTKAAKPPDEEIADLKSKIGAKIEKNDHGNITPLVKKLAEQLWLKGVRGLDPMIDSLHGILKEFVPSISRLETMDALSGRGKFTLPSQEAVKVAVRDLSARARLAAHIEDVQARRPLPRTGPQRDKPTAEQRRLTQQLNELKRKFGVRVTDPAAQLASALSAAKTYTRNRIADLKAEIAARQRIVKTKTPLQPDTELDAMRNELEAVKAEHEQVFGKRQLTDEHKIAIADKMLDRHIAKLESDLEAGRLTTPKRVSTTPETPELLAKRSWLQALREYRQDLRDALNPKLTPEERALKMVKTRIAKQMAEYQEKIAKGDYSKKSRTPTTLDQEAMRAKASLERVKQEWREGLERERLKGRSMREKVRDFIGRWRRELVLSGPSSIIKLMAAAAEGMVIDPIKESVGGAVGKAFPRFAARTELERPSSVAIEAKAWSQAFSHLMDDVVKTVKTGQSDLESAFGGKDAVPPEMRAYMGRLHAALKTPLKRQAWTRSAEILARDYLAKGIDIHDPLIQVEIGNKAFRQANRALFLEDNMVVDAYKRLLSRFEQVKPGQKPTIGQTVGAITLRTALPVVKIPTNLVSRTFQAGFGGFTGSARLATAYARGIEKLPPAEADIIMRQLKAGLPGSALLLLGFFAPEMFGGYYEPGKKRKPGELKPGHTKMAGIDIPPIVQHNPLIQLPQFGATVRRVMEERVSKYSLETKGIAPGALAASIGLLEETPFINEMLNIGKARQAPGKWLGAEAAGVITPQAVSQAAKFTDKDIYGTPIKRKATTFGEQIKVGIPGLRQSVPPSPQQ